MHDIPFFELFFIYSNQLVGLKIDLLFGFIKNKFEPLGTIKVNKELLANLMINDSSMIPLNLYKPTRFDFEYSFNEETFTYLEDWMFISVKNQVTARFKTGFNLNGFGFKTF